MTIGDKSAAQLGRDIASGALSSQEVTHYYIEQIKSHNPKINAVIDDRFEAAVAESHVADAAREAGDIKGALHGVPMTVKDAFEVEGLSCTVGAPQFANHISDRNAVVVNKLREAGAIILGKTNTPLFCGDWQSFNELHGTTNNPHNLEHTPGGSSGGSAAALAAGMTPLEYGSDIGGSIRIPAHYCGLFGHKPTYGIVSKAGHVPPPHGTRAPTALSVVGPLARSVEDLELALDLTIGLDAPQSNAMQLKLQAPRATTPQGLRIGVWSDDAYCAIDSELKSAIEEAAAKLGAAGAQIIDMRPDFTLAEHTEAYFMLLNPIMATSFPESTHKKLQAAVEAADPEDKSLEIMQARGARLLYKDWLLWDEARAQLAWKWQQYFEKVDVLFCPVTPTPAMPHTQTLPFEARAFSVNGKPRKYMENIIWAGISIMCGLPSTAVPLGKHSSGLPMGMQVVGPAYEDKTPIAVARMLEAAGYVFQKPLMN
ncbi:MAG: amidase [Alphaproteobacteria bacterium]|nr:amidase [Alphaproteobacteria bacterium]MBE8220528.1 amidase [Alphaproteobacteria bacterium]